MTENNAIGVPRFVTAQNWHDVARGKTSTQLNIESRKRRLDADNEHRQRDREVAENHAKAIAFGPFATKGQQRPAPTRAVHVGGRRQPDVSHARLGDLASEIYSRRNEGNPSTAREVINAQLGYRQLNSGK